MEITTLIIIAILVEAIVENIKTIYENGINGTRIIALILAIVICILTQTGIFLLLGIDFTLPIVDYILTGIVVSRGANFVNDIISKIRGE